METPANVTVYVNFTSPEQIHGLPDRNHTAVVAGWGRTSFSGPKSDHLLYAAVQIFDSSVCKAVTETLPTRKLKRGFDKRTQLCAVGTEGRDTCVVRKISLKSYKLIQIVASTSTDGNDFYTDVPKLAKELEVVKHIVGIQVKFVIDHWPITYLF